MLSIPSHEYTDISDTSAGREHRSKSGHRKSRLADRRDEIAIFAFVALLAMYIATATLGFLW